PRSTTCAPSWPTTRPVASAATCGTRAARIVVIAVIFRIARRPMPPARRHVGAPPRPTLALPAPRALPALPTPPTQPPLATPPALPDRAARRRCLVPPTRGAPTLPATVA